MFTEFYVDHAEPLAALSVFKDKRRWSLGDLPEGHEFLIILPSSGNEIQVPLFV
jgi:hypothetical protein